MTQSTLTPTITNHHGSRDELHHHAYEHSISVTLLLSPSLLTQVQAFQKLMGLSHSSSALRYLLYKGLQAELMFYHDRESCD